MKARLMSGFLIFCLLFTMWPSASFAATDRSGAPITATIVGDGLAEEQVTLNEGTIVAPVKEGYEFKTGFVSTAKADADRHYCNVVRAHNGKVYYSYRTTDSDEPLNGGIALKEGEQIYLAYTKLNDAYSINTSVDNGGNAANAISEAPASVKKNKSRFTIKLKVARGYDVSVVATAGGKSCATKALTKKQDVFEVSTEGIDQKVNHIDLSVQFNPVSTRTVSIERPTKENWHHARWFVTPSAAPVDENAWQDVTDPILFNPELQKYFGAVYTDGYWYNDTDSSVHYAPKTFKTGENLTVYLEANPGLNVNWRLNSFSINGEHCRIPEIPNDPTIAETINNSTNPEVIQKYIGHIFAMSKQPVTTTLSTGTEVTIRMIGASSMNVRPAFIYRIDIKNAYEDLEITDGNLNSLGWREIMVSDLAGVDAQAVWEPNGRFKDITLGIPVNIYPEKREKVPFRFKLKTGYINPKVYVDGKELPLGLTDEDGYTRVDVPYNDKLLFSKLEIKAEPIKHAIKYAAGDGHIAVNMPHDDHLYDITNSKVRISSMAPIETRGGYVFSHWKFTPHHGNTLPPGIKTEYLPGEILDFGPFLKHGNMSQAVHTITLTAVWTKSTEEKKLPYEVRYFFQDPQTGDFHMDTQMTEFLIGSKDQIIEYIGDPVARIKGTAYEGKYTYSKEASTLRNAISGDTLAALRVYYTNNEFTTEKSAALTYKTQALNNPSASEHGGSIVPLATDIPTNKYVETTYKRGNEIKPVPQGAAALAHEGYMFAGWYTPEGTLLSTETVFVPQKNAEGFYDTATYVAKFTVDKAHTAPVITASDKTIFVGEPFTEAIAKAGVTATETLNGNEKDITKRLGVVNLNDVNNMVAGTYPLEYAVTCEHGVPAKAIVNITVKPVPVEVQYFFQNEQGDYPSAPSKTGEYLIKRDSSVGDDIDMHVLSPETNLLEGDVHYRFDSHNEKNVLTHRLMAGPNDTPYKLYYERLSEGTATVTFRVEKGFWSNGGAERINVDVPLAVGTWKGTLQEKDVPQGMIPKVGYRDGAWDTAPNTEKDGITGDVTYTYRFKEDKNRYSVTYTDGVENEEVFKDVTHADLLYYADTPAFSADGKTPERAGYTFIGWSPEVTPQVTENATYTAQWEKRPSSGGGGVVTDKVTLHYETNGGNTYPDEAYNRGTTVTLDKVPSRDGYAFAGWFADSALTEPIGEITMSADKTIYAGWTQNSIPEMLNGTDHFAYIVGYTDGTAKPLNNITRAETAAIFHRLLKADIREANDTTVHGFVDIPENYWSLTPIATMNALGIIKGRSEGEFAPSAPITRAEFAVICARFDTGVTTGDASFTDISGHWAEEDIKRAATLGWVRGDAEGRFHPNDPITRAEAAALINRVLLRMPEDASDLHSDMRVWPDNQPGTWYYLVMQEATNSHDFTYKADGVHEKWTAIRND